MKFLQYHRSDRESSVGGNGHCLGLISFCNSRNLAESSIPLVLEVPM